MSSVSAFMLLRAHAADTIALVGTVDRKSIHVSSAPGQKTRFHGPVLLSRPRDRDSLRVCSGWYPTRKNPQTIERQTMARSACGISSTCLPLSLNGGCYSRKEAIPEKRHRGSPVSRFLPRESDPIL